MVRYSKLPFRMLLRKYNTDLVYSPMIVSNSFVKSQHARNSEFVTVADDKPLVVQFAASNSKDFADAAEYVAKYADAVDLNCGCPQRWAMAEGLGAYLMKHPERVCDMVRAAWQRTNMPVTIKIRVHKDIRTTVQMAQMAEKTGVSWIAVHGRTVDERHTPPNYDAIRQVKDALNIPVIANGDVFTDADSIRIQQLTGCDGVMSARGLLDNPALYAGYTRTPLSCVQDWVDINMEYGADAILFQKTLLHMTADVLSNAEHGELARLSSMASILGFLARFKIQFSRNRSFFSSRPVPTSIVDL